MGLSEEAAFLNPPRQGIKAKLGQTNPLQEQSGAGDRHPGIRKKANREALRSLGEAPPTFLCIHLVLSCEDVILPSSG